MTDTRDYHLHPSSIPSDIMKPASSASDQNVYLNYVCLVNGIKPSGNLTPNIGPSEKASLNIIDVSTILNEDHIPEDHPIQVERSKALHELAESYKRAELEEKAGEQTTTELPQYPTTTSGEDSDVSEKDENSFIPCDNPNVLKLTKMKWLTEDQDIGPDYSSASMSPTSSCSDCSQASESELNERNDKYLSTILRLDKEHNLFGLSNIAIVGAKPSKVKRKDDEKAVFHQTAIVQICCGNRYCCRNKSNTDLPASLKCGGRCRGCYLSCMSCAAACDPSPTFCLDDPPCPRISSTCCKPSPGCKQCSSCCPTSKCGAECSKCYGLKIKLNRKPVFVEPRVELTPRSSCVLKKPIAARSCYHNPRCIPPSSWFPYLMPCYWPARSSAPCTVPTRCFHNPPCLPARKPARVPVPAEYTCTQKCVDEEKKTVCENETCPARIPDMVKAIEKRFGDKSVQTPTTSTQALPEKVPSKVPST